MSFFHEHWAMEKIEEVVTFALPSKRIFRINDGPHIANAFFLDPTLIQKGLRFAEPKLSFLPLIWFVPQREHLVVAERSHRK